MCSFHLRWELSGPDAPRFELRATPDIITDIHNPVREYDVDWLLEPNVRSNDGGALFASPTPGSRLGPYSIVLPFALPAGNFTVTPSAPHWVWLQLLCYSGCFPSHHSQLFEPQVLVFKAGDTIATFTALWLPNRDNVSPASTTFIEYQYGGTATVCAAYLGGDRSLRTCVDVCSLSCNACRPA